jgi:hypothetical protein
MKAKTFKERRKIGRELARKKMKLAYWLMSEEGIDKSRAMRLAHGAFRLHYLLQKGVVTFDFFKLNGEVRKAVGTLCPEADSNFRNYLEAKGDHNGDRQSQEIENSGKITYWDVEKKGFRSLNVANLVFISEVRMNVNKMFV